MCFRQSSAANRIPLASILDFERARTTESIKMPYRKPLYWKWMWSMISRPGESRMEVAAAWDWIFDVVGEDLTNLTRISE